MGQSGACRGAGQGRGTGRSAGQINPDRPGGAPGRRSEVHTKTGACVYQSAAEIDTETETPSILMQQYGAENYYWYLIGEVDPYHLPSYSMPTATMFDSTATSAEYHYFQVIAHTDDTAVFWISEPDSGYSVDNLAPCPPVALMAEQSFTPEGLLLTWEPGTEVDLQGYRIYHGGEACARTRRRGEAGRELY